MRERIRKSVVFIFLYNKINKQQKKERADYNVLFKSTDEH